MALFFRCRIWRWRGLFLGGLGRHWSDKGQGRRKQKHHPPSTILSCPVLSHPSPSHQANAKQAKLPLGNVSALVRTYSRVVSGWAPPCSQQPAAPFTREPTSFRARVQKTDRHGPGQVSLPLPPSVDSTPPKSIYRFYTSHTSTCLIDCCSCWWWSTPVAWVGCHLAGWLWNGTWASKVGVPTLAVQAYCIWYIGR